MGYLVSLVARPASRRQYTYITITAGTENAILKNHAPLVQTIAASAMENTAVGEISAKEHIVFTICVDLPPPIAEMATVTGGNALEDAAVIARSATARTMASVTRKLAKIARTAATTAGVNIMKNVIPKVQRQMTKVVQSCAVTEKLTLEKTAIPVRQI